MPTLNFKIRYEKNTGLAISPSELLEGFFHGISLDDDNGNSLPVNVIQDKIASAQDQLESYLDIKLTPTIIEERRDFNRTEYGEWGFMKMTYPVKALNRNLRGDLGSIQQLDYPKEWISLKYNSEEALTNRTIHLVPSGSGNLVYIGTVPQIGFMGYQNIPNYFNIRYCTGFKKIPARLLEIVGMYASVPIFNILGDIILGAGIASQSLSLDGLSQSISTTSSAENSGYSSRVKAYLDEIKKELPILVMKYKGMNFDVC